MYYIMKYVASCFWSVCDVPLNIRTVNVERDNLKKSLWYQKRRLASEIKLEMKDSVSYKPNLNNHSSLDISRYDT